MESISELRKICQSTAAKDRSNVYMRYISRWASIYLTRLIVPTRISPDQVSFAMIVTGVLACLFFLFPSRGTFALGALLFQLWYILDCMDGEVARYRLYQQSGKVVEEKGVHGLSGIYYDAINHYIINLLAPLAIAIGMYQRTGEFRYLFLGLAAGVGQVLMLAMHDARHRVILTHLKKQAKTADFRPIENERNGPKNRSPWHWCFMAVHYTMTYPTVMNLVTVAALLNLGAPGLEWRTPLLAYLAAGSILVSGVTVSRTIAKRLIEAEVQERYRLGEVEVRAPNKSTP